MWGEIAAGAAGVTSGIIDSYTKAKAAAQSQRGARNAANTLTSGWNSTKTAYDKAGNAIDSQGNIVSSVYGDSTDLENAGSSYQDLLNSTPETYKASEFNYDKDVNDFYDKAWEVNNNAQLRALEGSAANAGHLYSSGLLNNMASTTSANATNAYKEAQDAYQTDKSNEQRIWAGNEAAKQAESTQGLEAYKTKTSNLSDYLSGATSAWGDVNNAKANLATAQGSSYQDYLNNLTNLQAQAGDYGSKIQVASAW